MKELNLLVWITQLGLGVAVPITAAVCLGIWLRKSFALGVWVFILCLVLGLLCALGSLTSSLKAMERMSKSKKEEDIPTVSFNDHH